MYIHNLQCMMYDVEIIRPLFFLQYTSLVSNFKISKKYLCIIYKNDLNQIFGL